MSDHLSETAPGSAGVPPAFGWRSRGYLPHFEGGSIPQFVTFRLADSLPAERLEQWRAELQHLPEREASAERRRRIEEWLDQGAGHAWLGESRAAQMVEEALLRFDHERYHLHAWVVMPNHVHVLLTPCGRWSLSAIVHSWKSFTSKRANRILGRRGRFWQEEYFDRFIRNQQHFERAVEYIEMNPVKAGLCELKQQWQFGSAAHRAGETPALPAHRAGETPALPGRRR